MRFSRAVTALCVVVLAGAGIGSTVASAAAPRAPQPKAADVGITDKQIRLAVVADVDNPAAPGLFQPSVDTVNAWAKNLNQAGGIAGRKIVIDFIDSKLNPDEARNATIQACQDDFAMVGSEAIFLNDVSDMAACPNAEGKPIGIPDMPGLALTVAQKCSPVTYVINGDSTFCATKDQHPQTYTTQQGDYLYYLSKIKDLHGIFTLPNDLKATRDSQLQQVTAGVNLGIKKDGPGFFDVTARSTQSQMTPIVKVIKDNSSNFAFNGEAPGIMVLLRREAKLQSADSVKIWACNQGCYDATFLKDGGSDVEGTYSVLTTLPFYSEYQSNPTLKKIAKTLGGVDKMNENAVNSLTAALLFQDAATKASAAGTLNRETLFAALKQENAFDAQGIIGPLNIGAHEPPRCIVMTQVKNGKWVRAHPTKTGTFDCNKKNLVTLKLDL